jgi:hypothetical protein
LTAQQQSNKFETFAANKNCRDITNLTMLTWWLSYFTCFKKNAVVP